MLTFLYVQFFLLNSIELDVTLGYMEALMRLAGRPLGLFVCFLHIRPCYHLPRTSFQNKLRGGSDVAICYVYSILLRIWLQVFCSVYG